MTVPAAVLPLRTLMQRPVLEALTKKLPVWTSGVMPKACEAPPLQLASTMPVLLVPTPASRHIVGWLMGEMVQLEPLAVMLKIDEESPAEAFHCWMGEVPASMTIAPPVLLAERG